MSDLEKTLKDMMSEKWDKALFKSVFLTSATYISLFISVLLVLPSFISDGITCKNLLLSLVRIVISTVLLATLYRLPAILVHLQYKANDEGNKEIGSVKDLVKDVLKDVNTALSAQTNSINSLISSKLDSIGSSVGESLHKIDDCPRLTAFHTENGSFKNRMEDIEALKPNQRWMMSKFISKLIGFHFDSFTLRMETRQYSLFSKEIMKECIDSVLLTGSMRPSTWLFRLADENQTTSINFYFNNLFPIKSFPLGEGNHSLFLNKVNIRDRLRVVCLSPDDMINLFISERSVDTYFDINNPKCGVNTFFTLWQDGIRKKMKPLKYEYALYDRSLLFKFDREKEELTVINGNSTHENSDNNDEFKEVVNFFDNPQNVSCSRKSYDEIILEIQKQKLRLLNRIRETKLLPHKYSYLYSGADSWTSYTKEKTKYGVSSTIAIEKAIRSLIKKETKPLDIIEIGAGNGNRISTVCDAIGTDNINTYTVVDISSSLLDKANSVLQGRIPNNKCKSVVFDCCLRSNQNQLKEMTKEKTVLILSNSTLFQEDGFKWESLNQAKQILLSIDLVTDENNTYDDLIKAKKLFLLPLKIFEIPIIDGIIDGLIEYLFSREIIDVNDTLAEVNIIFNLKLYINILKYVIASDKDSFSRALDQLAEDEKIRKDFADKINKISKEIELPEEPFELFEYLSDNKHISTEYLLARNDFYEMDRLIVLSCLKMRSKAMIEKEAKNSKKMNVDDEKVKEFFSKYGFDVKTKVVNERFVGILLTPFQE